MQLLDVTWFGFSAWRLCASAALLLLFVVLKIRSMKADAAQTSGSTAGSANRTLKYTDAPTVRLTDTQHIDRLHRIVSLKAGEQADLKELTFGRIASFQLALTGIEQDSGQEYARIHIELGGAIAGCGDSVKELNENDFLVPRAAADEQRSAILYFCGKPDAVSFLQVKVRRIDLAEQSAAIDVLHVRGRWAA